METQVLVKGQVVIPAEIRRRLGLKQGTKLHVEEHDGEIVLRPLDRRYFESMAGFLKGSGLTKGLEASRKEDRKREEAELDRRQGAR